MKFIYPTVELLPQETGIDGIYKQIELTARTCYKSEGNQGKEFVDRLINNKHMAMLEHGTVYLTIPFGAAFKDDEFVEKYKIKNFFAANSYSRCVSTNYSFKETCPEEFLDIFDDLEGVIVYYITTNLRVILETFEDPEEVLRYISEPTKHVKRISMRIICDRINSQSFMRHRVFSFAQESTRYCNYSKSKFGKEITYIIPTWITNFEKYVEDYGLPCEGVILRPPITDNYLMSEYNFFYSLYYSEEHYFRLLDLGRSPQEARQVLPNALKTEFVMTGFIDDWKRFLEIRTTNTYGVPHPDMRSIAISIKNILKL